MSPQNPLPACAAGPRPIFTLLLCACFAALEVEVADHVVNNPLPPLKGDDDSIVFVSPLELVRAHKHTDLLLVQDFNWVGRRLQPPHWGSILLLVNESCKVDSMNLQNL